MYNYVYQDVGSDLGHYGADNHIPRWEDSADLNL